MSFITSDDWEGFTCVLVNSLTRTPVHKNHSVLDFRGDLHYVKGGSAPHKPSSTGRVFTTELGGHDCELFPSVVGLEWVRTLSNFKGE